MKLNIPMFIGAAVVVAGLGALVLWKPEVPIEQVVAPSAERLRRQLQNEGRIEGANFTVEAPIILNKSDDELNVRVNVKFKDREPGLQYHRYLQREGRWEFDRDVGASFAAFVETEKNAACDRLGKRLAERYQDKVNIPGESVRIGHRVREATENGATRLIGSIDVRYNDRGAEGRYVEDFALKGDTWTLEGEVGQLFDRGPRTSNTTAPAPTPQPPR